MEIKEIDCFRENIDGQIQQKYKEIDTNISYIIIGSLGFFITMMEKFIDVKTVFLLPIMVFSLLSLLIAFTLFLYSKQSMAKHAANILDFIDDTLIPDPSNIELEQKLLSLWKKSNESLRKQRNWIYICVGVGVIFEVGFFTSNVFFQPEPKQPINKAASMEVVAKDSVNLNINRKIK